MWQDIRVRRSGRLRAVALLLALLSLPTSNLFAETKALQSPPQAFLAVVYPIMGPRMSSDYGMRMHPIEHIARHHEGIDLAAPEGAPIRSIADGVVVYADPHGGYGRFIAIRHKDGYTSHYGHCKSVEVAPGQRIKAGEVIGTVGSTGLSTGPHLHFEVRRNGLPKDPEKILPGLAEAAAG